MSALSKMIFKLYIVVVLFRFVNFVHAEYIDVDPKDVKALATPPTTVTGDLAYDGEYPFSVIFYEHKPREIRMGSFLSPICSGAVINAWWILTTAIPLGNYPINKYFLLAGLKVIVEDPDVVMNYTDNLYRIEMMVVHPKWHEYDVNNVGMVRTTQPLKFGKELGTIRMPSVFNINVPEGHNDTACTLNIWASNKFKVQHLMGPYQLVPISKQTIYLNLTKDALKYCSDIVYTDKTLCLTQFDTARPHDICTVNLGAIVQCDCQAVGIFTGINGKLDCVDLPPTKFTAVNITQFLKWITKVSEAPEIKPHNVHQISSAYFIYFSYNLAIICVVLWCLLNFRIKLKAD